MPSNDDKFPEPYIKVNPSGGHFHLYNPGDISEINLTDIASAISRQCRFTGHLLEGVEVYSVAEHSVLVSYIIEKMGGTPREIFEGLMHDCAEAYLADIAAPFKRELGSFYEKEALIAERINKRFGLSGNHDGIVKTADWYALWIEARQIVVREESVLEDWVGYEEFGRASMEYQMPVQCWLPSRAKVEFLCRFAQCQDLVLGEDNA